MQVRGVTSEALEAKIRQLLPSQAGFTEELSAQNLIVPIIDITAAAEGSDVPQYLQTALTFASQTAFSVTNTTSTLINTTGFYRVFGVANVLGGTAAARDGHFDLSDGSTDKKIWEIDTLTSASNPYGGIQFDFVVFMPSGDELKATCSQNCSLVGSFRQVATVTGTLVNPSGFTPE